MSEFWEAAKWQLFYRLEVLLAGFRRRPDTPSQRISNIREAESYLWVYCATIGELNGCKPLLRQLSTQGQLVLITDRHCYRDQYLAAFPEAIVVELGGEPDEPQSLLQRFPPRMMILCEIPGLLHDAPCRLGYGLVRALKRHGARLYLVNGWLYRYQPACRMDKLEHWLFADNYLAAFDFITVQTGAVKEHFLAAGCARDKIRVTGNIKFDCLDETPAVDGRGELDRVLAGIGSLKRPVIVAGCLASLKESQRLINSHRALSRALAEPLLILAPRHPENRAFMAILEQQLADSGLTYGYKTRLAGETADGLAILVLDTIGELKRYYAVADVCYVGLNHNVLEPLSFGKPVLVSPGWEATYPSFPVYEMARSYHLLDEVYDEASLAATLTEWLTMESRGGYRDVAGKLEHLRGATVKNLQCLGLAVDEPAHDDDLAVAEEA